MQRSDRFPFLPAYTRALCWGPCWDRCPIAVSLRDMYTCFCLDRRLNLRTFGCGTGYPLPGLIRVPLLIPTKDGSHQRFATPRHISQTDRLCNTSSPPRHQLPASCCQSVTPKDVSVMDMPPYAAISATWLTTVPAAT